MKKIVLLITSIISLHSLEGANHLYSVNISRNSYGIDPITHHASYDDVAQRVTISPLHGDERYKKIIPMVYVRKLISDPPGHNFIGTVPNPRFNPGFITESTSYRPIFDIYATKY